MGAPNFAKDIRDYLSNVALITPTTYGQMAPSPVVQYAVIEYPGMPNVKTHGAAVVLDNGRLQIQARAATNASALANILGVVNALDGLKDVTINGVVYLWVTEVSRPRLTEMDESGLVTYSWECELQSRR